MKCTTNFKYYKSLFDEWYFNTKVKQKYSYTLKTVFQFKENLAQIVTMKKIITFYKFLKKSYVQKSKENNNERVFSLSH